MFVSDETAASVVGFVGAAAALDFGLLDQMPKGVLVTLVLGATSALMYFVKRDYARFVKRDEAHSEALKEVHGLMKKIDKRTTIIETKLGMHETAPEETESTDE